MSLINGKLRPSSADRIVMCADALVKPKVKIDSKNYAAVDGTAKHEIAAAVVDGVSEINTQAIADYHNVENKNLVDAEEHVRRIWAELQKHPDMQDQEFKTELEIDGEVSHGTADVASMSGVVLDWKFGWSLDEHPAQLRAYAECLMKVIGKFPEKGYILGIEVWVRHNELRMYKFTESSLINFRKQINEQKEKAGNSAIPGVHCKFCPRSHECKARDAYIKESSQALVSATSNKIESPLDLGRLWDQAALLKSSLDKYYKAIDEVVSEGGSLDIGAGRHIESWKKVVRTIKPREAWPLLVGEFKLTQEEMAGCITVGKTKLEVVVKSKAEKGKKAAAVKKLLKTLDDNNAIDKKTSLYKKVVTQ